MSSDKNDAYSIKEQNGKEADEFDLIICQEEIIKEKGFLEGFEKGDQQCQLTAFSTCLKVLQPLSYFKGVLLEYLDAATKKLNPSQVEKILPNELDQLSIKILEVKSVSEFWSILEELNCGIGGIVIEKNSYVYKYFKEELLEKNSILFIPNKSNIQEII